MTFKKEKYIYVGNGRYYPKALFGKECKKHSKGTFWQRVFNLIISIMS